MKDNIQRFWKEYLIAVAIIVITGIFMNVDMVKFLQTMTGFAVSKSTATIVVNYSYIFLIILGPLLLIGTAGYSYYLNRIEHHNAQDLHRVKFSSMDHEFHHFPHDSLGLNSASNEMQHTTNNSTIQPMNSILFIMQNSRCSDTSHLLCYPNAMDHHVLKQHIKNKLMQGSTMTEISEKLLEHNWSLDKINTAFNDLKLTNVESEIMLGSFVTTSLIAGYDINTIRQSLVQKGWESRKVDKVINLVFK